MANKRKQGTKITTIHVSWETYNLLMKLSAPMVNPLEPVSINERLYKWAQSVEKKHG